MNDGDDSTPVDPAPAEDSAVKRAVKQTLQAIIDTAKSADSKLHAGIATLETWLANIDRFGAECDGCDNAADKNGLPKIQQAIRDNE